MPLTVKKLLHFLKGLPPTMEIGILNKETLDIDSAGVFFGVARRSKNYKDNSLDDKNEIPPSPWTLVDVIKLRKSTIVEGLGPPPPSCYEEEQLFCIFGPLNEFYFQTGDLKIIPDTSPVSYRLYRPDYTASRLSRRVYSRNKEKESENNKENIKKDD